MSETGYVSLIQYQPDAARLEVANVGIFLFCPKSGWFDLMMVQGLGNTRKFFGPAVDSEFLNDSKIGLESRLRAQAKAFSGPEDVRLFAKRLGNELVMTDPRGIAVTRSHQAVLGELFEKLVLGGQTKERVPRSSLGRRLHRFFDKLPDQSRIVRNKTMVLPEVDLIEAPYAYVNGKLNLVKPIGLSPKSQDEARSWFLIAQLLEEQSKASHDSATVDVILARADGPNEQVRREYCEKVLRNSKANLFFEESLDDFEDHVGNAMAHR